MECSNNDPHQPALLSIPSPENMQTSEFHPSKEPMPSDGADNFYSFLTDISGGSPLPVIPNDISLDIFLSDGSSSESSNTTTSHPEMKTLPAMCDAPTLPPLHRNSYSSHHDLAGPKRWDFLTSPPCIWSIHDCHAFFDLASPTNAEQLHEMLCSMKNSSTSHCPRSIFPMKMTSPTPKNEKVLLYQFILAVLEHPKYSNMAAWIEPHLDIFYVFCNRELASLWGAYKGCHKMNWDKMSRGIRFRMLPLRSNSRKSNVLKAIKRSTSFEENNPFLARQGDPDYIKFERVPQWFRESKSHNYPKKLVFRFKHSTVVKFQNDTAEGKYREIFLWLDSSAAANILKQCMI